MKILVARLRLHLPRLATLAAMSGCAVQAGDEAVGRTSEAASVCATGSVVQGVDVSVYQGSVNWTSVKASGIDFAIARISDGSALDSDFASNWTGMKSAGLVRGAYQYFEPGQDPTTQADIVIKAVGMLGAGDLPVTADMETTGSQSAATIAANLQTWASAVQAGTGKKPMVYTASGYWDSDVASSAFASNPLWVANWGVSCPSMPTGWSGWTFWQSSDTGSVSGISGAVDLDEFNGSLSQLQTFAGGGSTSSDGGTTSTAGTYGAQYVSQSWPLASTAMTMTTCQTLAATITLKNVGTKSWDSNTRLATSQPRDRASLFADSTWVSTKRVAQVTGTVPPGSTYEFKFDFHAPPTAGTYTEYFGLVEEGVAWFSDPGQDGPADNDIEANIQVTAGSTACTADPGVPDGGSSVDSGAATNDAGNGGGNGGGPSSDDAGTGVATEAGTPTSGGGNGSGPDPDAGFAWDSAQTGHGCSVNRGSTSRSSAPGGMALAGLLALVALRRKARQV